MKEILSAAVGEQPHMSAQSTQSVGKMLTCVKPIKQCKPNPCGPNTECVVVNSIQRCTCKPGYTESIKTIQGCIKFEPPEPILSLCELGPCGDNAECLITDSGEDCRCNPGLSGNAFDGCVPDNPCNPSPCRPNTECNENRIGQVVCSCIRRYQGDPTYARDRRAECLQNSDCSPAPTCVAQKYIDPCPGTCGVSAVCAAAAHSEGQETFHPLHTEASSYRTTPTKGSLQSRPVWF